ncbi:MAG: 2-C-methyl-D-erythritol 4-phosphate cytidylyltransferase [Bacteroidia bacterium]
METKYKKIALIVAGGAGTRMESAIPKQFILLKNKPILQHTIEKLNAYDASMRLIVVLPASQLDYWKTLCRHTNFWLKHELVAGGSTRFESVSNGLATIKNETNAIVFVHDGVRPFVSNEVLNNCYQTTVKKGNAIPAISCVESMRTVGEEGTNKHVNRADYRVIQTPQTFKIEQLIKAYKVAENPIFTDDASVVEHSGITINLVPGNVENIKITTPFDLIVGEGVLGR